MNAKKLGRPPKAPKSSAEEARGSIDNLDVDSLTLGERLAMARQQRGLTQKQLSEMSGKSRATVIQYEQGRLQPPLAQIQAMADVLQVAPEFIAFGRQSFTGLHPGSASGASLPEIDLGDPNEPVTGSFGFSADLVEDFGIKAGDARVYILTHEAPAFGLAKGDRVIVNSTDVLAGLNRLFAFKTPMGLSIARLLPNLSASKERVHLTGGFGENRAYKAGELHVLGMVVGSIQAR